MRRGLKIPINSKTPVGALRTSRGFFVSGVEFCQIAAASQRAKVSYWNVSMAKNGHYILSPAERARLAGVLGVPEDELFATE